MSNNTSSSGGAPGDRQQEPLSAIQLTRNTFALILAGGRGSRLHELTDFRAKPAVPFGGKFRIIDFALSNCVNSGVRRVGIATQYKSQSLIRHLQLGWSFLDGRLNEFIEIMPAQQQSDEEHWYQGTADAVFQNLREIHHARPKYVLILSGDHIYRMDFAKLLAFHAQRGADMSVACIEVPLEQASSFGVMSVDDEGQVLEFAEKPAQPKAIPGNPDSALTSMGIYVFNASFLCEQLRRDAEDPTSSHDFGKDIIPYCVQRHKVYAQNFAQSCVYEPGKAVYWRDVGTLDAYWSANMDLVHVTPDLNLYADNWPIWTWQPQKPPDKFVFDDEGRRGMAVDSMVSGGCIVSGATVRRSILFPSVRVHSYSSIEDSILLPNVQVGRHCVLKKCIVDKNSVIPEGAVIGLDPVKDRQRFRVTESGITLVTKEMLGQYERDLR